MMSLPNRRSLPTSPRALLAAVATLAAACVTDPLDRPDVDAPVLAAIQADSAIRSRDWLVQGSATDDRGVARITIGWTTQQDVPREIAITPGRSVTFAATVRVPPDASSE